MVQASVVSNRRLLSLVALLYVAEGLPYGVVNELVPVWLKVRGLSLEDLGLLQLVGLPWVLKPLWAPLVDRYGTTARWVAGALGGAAAITAILPSLRGTGLPAALVLLAFLSATQDVAIDGFTATEVPPAQLGRVNGVRVAAYRFAMLLAGGGTVALAGTLPWSALFAGLGIAMGVLALVATQIPGTGRPPAPAGSWMKELASWGLAPGAAVLFLFAVLFKLGDAAMSPMLKPFWLDAGLTLEEVGVVSITLSTIATVVGALLGGEVTTRIGIGKALWTLGGLQALSNLAYAGAALEPSRPLVYGASIVEAFCGGLGTAAFLAVLMRACEQRQAATRFAILTAIAGLTRTIAGAISGYGAHTLGYAGWFAVTFCFAIPGLLLVPSLVRRYGVA
jgi:MFS transporter, PAT family, beta-lactamase induction signal transducer AmpG